MNSSGASQTGLFDSHKVSYVGVIQLFPKTYRDTTVSIPQKSHQECVEFGPAETTMCGRVNGEKGEVEENGMGLICSVLRSANLTAQVNPHKHGFMSCFMCVGHSV